MSPRCTDCGELEVEAGNYRCRQGRFDQSRRREYVRWVDVKEPIAVVRLAQKDCEVNSPGSPKRERVYVGVAS